MTDWLCIDCGTDTAPGLALSENELARALVLGESVTVSAQSEIYCIQRRVREAAGTSARGARLCVGCLEKRLGRQLHRDDFVPGQVFNSVPGTARLVDRRNAPNPNPPPPLRPMGTGDPRDLFKNLPSSPKEFLRKMLGK